MKAWWVQKGWPWLKENWWAVILAPFAIVVGGAMLVRKFFDERPSDSPVLMADPLAPADERALHEAATRNLLLVQEKRQLAEALRISQAQHEEMQKELDRQFGTVAAALQLSPDELKERMLRVGPGGKKP